MYVHADFGSQQRTGGTFQNASIMDRHSRQKGSDKPATPRAYLVVDNVAFGVGLNDEDGLKLKVTPQTYRYFPGRLELRFLIRYDENSRKEGEQIQVFLTEHNTRNMVYRDITYTSDNLPLCLTNKPQLLACIGNKYNKKLFSVQFDYDPSHIHAVDFFTTKTYGGQQDKIDFIRKVFSCSGRLSLLIEGLNTRELLTPFLKEMHYGGLKRLRQWYTISKEDKLCNMVIRMDRCRLDHGGIANSNIPCMVSFASREEYATIMSFAIMRENRKLIFNTKTRNERKWEIRVFTLPGFGDRCYLAFLRPKKGDVKLLDHDSDDALNSSFKAGTRIRIQFDSESEESWTALTVDYIPSIPTNDIQLFLKRPWDDIEADYAFDIPSTVSPTVYSDSTDFNVLVEQLETVTPVPVVVTFNDEQMAFNRSLKALNDLRLDPTILESKDETWDILLANKPARLPTRNLYQGLDDLKLDGTFLIEEQRSAIAMMKNIPGGMMLISGPHNSGKPITTNNYCFLLWKSLFDQLMKL